MPEALVVFFIFAASVIVYVVAWIRSRDPSLVNVHDDLQRLRHREVWLRERLLRAEREQWGDAMIASIADELHTTSHQLARITVAAAAR